MSNDLFTYGYEEEITHDDESDVLADADVTVDETSPPSVESVQTDSDKLPFSRPPLQSISSVIADAFADSGDGIGLPQEEIDDYWSENPEEHVLRITQTVFRKHNPVSSVLYRISDEMSEYLHGEGFNLAASIQESVKSGELSEDDIDYFGDCRSYGKFQRIKRELADNKLLKEASWYETAIPKLMGGALDPACWIPIGRALKLSTGIGKMIFEASYSALVSAGMRHDTQELMTHEDVALETVSAGIFSGVLGGAGKFVKSDTFKGWTKNLKDYFKSNRDEHFVFVHKNGLYTGNASNGTVVKSKVSGSVSKLIENSPYLRGVMSKDANFRDIMTSILRSNNIITKETREGGTQVLSAESAIDYTHNMWEGVKKKYTDIYKKFMNTKFASENNWQKEEFNLEVSRYIRGVSRKSKYSKEVDYESHPEVKQAGDEILNFWDRMLDEGEKNNVIPRNYIGANKNGILAKGAVLTKEEASIAAEEFAEKALSGELSDSKVTSFGHFSRIYDVDKIQANEKAFKEFMYRSVFKNNPQWSEKQMTERLAEIMSHVKNTDVGNRFKLMGFDFKGNIGGKFTKPRSVAVTDDLLEPFLVNNPLEVGDGLVRRLSTATELNRVAMSKGHRNWEDLLDAFSKNRNIENVSLSGNQSKAFGEQTKEYQQYLVDTADMLMGTYGKWDNPKLNYISGAAKAWNAMRHLGGVLVSSICDVAGAVSRFGLADTIKGAVDAFKKQGITNNQGWKKVLQASETSLTSSKMFDETYRQFGNKPLGKASKLFMKLTGLPYWNDYWKKITATLHYSDILEACMNPSKEGGLFLRQHRISESMREAIVKQYKKYGYEHGGNYILPLDRITDENISKALYSTIKTMADETIITVGAGDVQRFLCSGVGSALLQYRTFSYAYFNNIVMPQFMQSESRNHTAEYLLTTAVLAPLTQAAKYVFRGDGDKIEESLNSGEFWYGALKDSGLIGHILDTAEFGVTVFQDPDRAASRVSPLYGLGSDIVKAVKIPFQKRKATESQLRRVKGLIPFNNMFCYNWAINGAIRNYSEQTGRRLKK